MSLAMLKAITDWTSSPTTPFPRGSPFSKYALVVAMIFVFPPDLKSAATASIIKPISLWHFDDPL